MHPDRPGLYLAGVECDGATYHGSPSARDRDRTRHAILENLGWRLVRLWSTDYFRDPDAAIQAIHTRLSEILEEDRARQPEQVEEVVEDIVVDLDSPIEELDVIEGDQQDELVVKEGAEYPSSVYFEPSHEPVLVEISKEILEERPCITLKALALEVASRHGRIRPLESSLSCLPGLFSRGQVL